MTVQFYSRHFLGTVKGGQSVECQGEIFCNVALGGIVLPQYHSINNLLVKQKLLTECRLQNMSVECRFEINTKASNVVINVFLRFTR